MTRGVEVSLAGIEAVDDLAALHRSSFEDVWGRDAIARVIDWPGAFALIAHAAGDAVGMALARVVRDEAEILALGVTPAHRRRGAGRALVAAAAARATTLGAATLYLEVAADNHAAHALYSDFGFIDVGRRPRYYRRLGGAADALIMRCPLASHTVDSSDGPSDSIH